MSECKHRMKVNRDNIGICGKCGQEVQFPWDPKQQPVILKEGKVTSTLTERKKYYDNNKEAILADLDALGRRKTLKKWGIPTSTLAGLEKRWGRSAAKTSAAEAPTHGAGGVGTVGTVGKVGNVNNHELPPFPPLDTSWPEAVQLKWFDVYERLSATRGGDGGPW